MPFDLHPSAEDLWPLRLERVVYGESAADRRALIDGLELTLEPGRPTALLGPNGAGKSLTLRLIQGLISPCSGRVACAGRPLAPSDRRRIALAPQRPVLLRRTLRANLDHALRAYGVPRRDRPARIDRLLALGRLEALAERPARALSGGEQQRASLIRALAAAPRLLLLDEPCASLDPEATQAVEALIAEAAASGVKVLLVSHDLGQARRLAGDVAFLHRGRIVERAPVDAFFGRPASPQAQAFIEGRLVL